METITVRGRSQKGKNRVRERGPVWIVKTRSDTVRFSAQLGPWLFLESLDGQACRWMHATEDKDFEVVS